MQLLALNSGKTTMLKAIANELPNESSLYLAYNRSIALESKKKFPKSVECSTTHSLAYRTVIPTLKHSNVGDVGWRDIKPLHKSAKYDVVMEALDNVKEFCLSGFLEWDDFSASKSLDDSISTFGRKIMDDMYDKKLPLSHDYYLKLFHKWLAAGIVTFNEFDILMLDEAGDLNAVTMEIFKLLPAKLKIAVGDQHQNIYTFNHTINCFQHLQGTTFDMTQSFRVSPDIAARVEKFSQQVLSPNMTFKGTVQTNELDTHAYITRTNGMLISKMIELNKSKTPYTLSRPASEIFKIPLMLCWMKKGGYISNPKYKHLQADYDDYFKYTNIKTMYKTPLSYIQHLHAEEDPALKQALSAVLRFGREEIFSAFEEAKKHERKKTNYTLCTAHSSKGLEFGHVEIAEDMNTSTAKAISRVNTDNFTLDDLASLNLYYVAATRASLTLTNANLLPKD
jgi:F-box protein 18 (helicase)